MNLGKYISKSLQMSLRALPMRKIGSLQRKLFEHIILSKPWLKGHVVTLEN